MRNIKVNAFKPSSINKAIKELKAYKKSIKDKTAKFTEMLADAGISVAKMNTGPYGGYIVFSKDTKIRGKIIKTYMIAENTSHIIVNWDTGSSDLNPILMSEFGSGWYADDKRGKKFGAGQGTHPQGRINANTGKLNAFNPKGWVWSENGGTEWHHSYGEKPYSPMAHAATQMYVQINMIARRAFKGV